MGLISRTSKGQKNKKEQDFPERAKCYITEKGPFNGEFFINYKVYSGYYGTDVIEHNSNLTNRICDYLIDNPDVDPKIFGAYILNYGSAIDNYNFAKNVKGAYILDHQQAIQDCEVNDYNYNKYEMIYKYARDVPGADIESLAKSFLNISNFEYPLRDVPIAVEINFPKSYVLEYQYLFARDIPGLYNEAFQTNIVLYGDEYLNYKYAKDVKGADTIALARKIFDTRNKELLYKYARDVPDADIKAFEKVIIKYCNSDDAENKKLHYKFARDIPGVDIKALGEYFLNNKDTEYNILFAKNVKGADINAHANVIIENTELLNKKYGVPNINPIVIFATEVEGADVEMLQDAVKNMYKKYYPAEKVPNLTTICEEYKKEQNNHVQNKINADVKETTKQQNSIITGIKNRIRKTKEEDNELTLTK